MVLHIVVFSDEVEDNDDDDQGEGGEGGQDADQGGGGYMKECFQWLVSGPKLPPRQWETYRREEIEQFIAEKRSALVGRMLPEWVYFQTYRRRAMKYTGDYDLFQQREGRGVCIWPDPPYGGGGLALPPCRHRLNAMPPPLLLRPRLLGEGVSN